MTEVEQFFSKDHAAHYDKTRKKLAPLKDALNLITQGIFADLPATTHLLCVGAGTGDELLYLAQAFPRWRFTAVEPAPDMMQLCREKAEHAGISARCQFHQGYVDSLRTPEKFDAATAILVSQFLMERDARVQFFAEITKRLVSGAPVINADFASDLESSEYQRLLEFWLGIHSQTGMQQTGEHLGKLVAVLPRHEIEDILKAGGLRNPTVFYQAILIHAWHSTVP